MIEAKPLELLRHVETFEDRGDGAAGPYPGKIVRTGIEAVETRLTQVTRLAHERMAESARHDMVLGDDHLETGIGQERRRRQSADAGADHSHVEIRAAHSAPELERRPSVSLKRCDEPLYGDACEEFRAENGDQRAGNNDAVRDPCAGPQHLRRGDEQEQHAPQARKDHVDGLENRTLGGLRECRAGIIRGPGLSASHCHKADQTETRERERSRIGADELRRDQIGKSQAEEDGEAADLELLISRQYQRQAPPASDRTSPAAIAVPGEVRSSSAQNTTNGARANFTVKNVFMVIPLHGARKAAGSGARSFAHLGAENSPSALI